MVHSILMMSSFEGSVKHTSAPLKMWLLLSATLQGPGQPQNQKYSTVQIQYCPNGRMWSRLLLEFGKSRYWAKLMTTWLKNWILIILTQPLHPSTFKVHFFSGHNMSYRPVGFLSDPVKHRLSIIGFSWRFVQNMWVALLWCFHIFKNLGCRQLCSAN